MISSNEFYKSLSDHGVDFFTGVPDSLLKDVCGYITDETPAERNIIAANEGGSIALALGYHLATGKVPLVYMQNSGFGNTVNPLLSLADPKVYSVPMLLLIGWRGEPGVKDEPQHVKQGKVSEELLQTMEIPYEIISSMTTDIDAVVEKAISLAIADNTPFAILVRKGTFEPYSLKNKVVTNHDLNREEAVIKASQMLKDEDVVVATTGKTSRELFEYRARNNQGHHRDFLTVGGMGHANQIALGIALSKPEKEVYCFDGDGAVLMHTGSLGIVGSLKPKNYKHIVFNNGAHDSVGGQPTIGFDVDFCELAKNFNYKHTFKISNVEEFEQTFKKFQNSEGPSMLEVLINKGARKELGRPTKLPLENKRDFMDFLG